MQSERLSYKIMTIAIGRVVYQKRGILEQLSFLVYVLFLVLAQSLLHLFSGLFTTLCFLL